MERSSQEITRKVLETITLNTQKGEPYRIAFRGEPDRIYEGIPIVPTSDPSGAERAFDLKVLAPTEVQGRIIRCSADDVVLLEKID
jgi:phage-related protein